MHLCEPVLTHVLTLALEHMHVYVHPCGSWRLVSTVLHLICWQKTTHQIPVSTSNSGITGSPKDHLGSFLFFKKAVAFWGVPPSLFPKSSTQAAKNISSERSLLTNVHGPPEQQGKAEVLQNAYLHNLLCTLIFIIATRLPTCHERLKPAFHKLMVSLVHVIIHSYITYNKILQSKF